MNGPDSSEHVLELVSQALDNFEARTMASSLRGAMRIAHLLGDTAWAARFGLELGFIEPTAVALDDPIKRRVITEFAESRLVRARPEDIGWTDTGQPARFESPVDQLERLMTPASYETETSLRSRMEWENQRKLIGAILAKLKNLTFRYLIGCETQLRLSVTGDRLFQQHRARVDSALRRVAPEVLDRLASAIKRAAESGQPEERAQAAVSCRRVLESVADIVFPARDDPYVDGAGQERTVDKVSYRNRLIAAVEQAGAGTHGRAVRSSVGELAQRVDTLDELVQKGIHDEVSQEAVDFAVVQTYLLAGEVLLITGERRGSNPDEPS